MSLDVLLVPTGTANLASVLAALRRVGARPAFASSPGDVRAADRVVLPGVGAFRAAMGPLRERGFAQALTARLREDRPFLGVCLGLQLLAATSEESPGERGLGFLPLAVSALAADGLRMPHIGWNHVEAAPGCRVLASGEAYFANSYRLERVPEGFSGASALHGEPFVAAIERGSIVACQFHPELSGEYGLSLLERWLQL